MLLLLGWTAVRRGDARLAAGTALTGAGTVVAYAVSEALKLVVDEERPCRGRPRGRGGGRVPGGRRLVVQCRKSWS